MKIEFGQGLTSLEKTLIRRFYRQNPKKLEQLQSPKKEEELKLEVKTKGYKYADFEKYASYKKVVALVDEGILKEGIHYTLSESGKKIWTKEAIELTKKLYYVSNEEKKELEDLYFYFTDDLKFPLYRISKELCEILDLSDKTIYNFLYTLFNRKPNKDKYKKYITAFKILKKQYINKEKQDENKK